MKDSTAESAAALLEEIAHLMKLKGENPFKVRAFEKAMDAIREKENLVELAKGGSLTQISGVGSSIAEILTEFLLQGKSSVREELQASLPPGLEELTQVPGLGPKKAMTLIQELEIRSLSELEYACRENRLLKLKGFGEKAQNQILQGIQFLNSHAGQQRISDALESADTFVESLKLPKEVSIFETGALRRRLEILSSLDFLVKAETAAAEKSARGTVEKSLAQFQKQNPSALPVRISYCQTPQFGYEWARHTSTPEHWKALGSPKEVDTESEEKFYEKIGLTWIPPEARETGEEVALAKKGPLKLLPEKGVRGIFHNHTTRSDGAATLEEMVRAAEKAGYSYIGISDHSQSAVYAQGLKTPDLMDQRAEVKKIQEKFPNIRIFWGIESDILQDGSLDYDDKILSQFDFVIASIHSRFKMDREAMTDRILKAIRNPRTRFLGHATGRLLLGRKAYDMDMERVIQEAADHDVAIEINANPARLDIDWRWGSALRRSKTLVSVNPDAHETAGIDHVKFGVTVARKALIPVDQVVNARSVAEVEKWLRRA